MARSDFDLAIIGAGAGGLIAARFAAQLGARVLLAERDRIGGDCTWTGCVPSKSLIRVAKAAHEIRTAQRFGIGGGSCTVDMTQVRDYVQRKVQEIYEPTAPDALTREGIEVALGPASFERRTHVAYRRAVHRRATLSGVHRGHTGDAAQSRDWNGTPHFTYHNIFDSARLPASLVVIGGGPLGMELAQAFQRLGSQVTILAPRLLPHDDPEAVSVLRRVFEREGVRLVHGRAVSVTGKTPTDIVVASDTGGAARGECLLVAAGRRPNIAGLALDRAGVAHSERGIVVDDRLRTNVPHIYAAGDVLGGEQFSHVAGWQAFEATRNALLPGSSSGRPNPMAWVTFTDPGGRAGRASARRRRGERFGDAVTVTRWDIARVDRAKCDDDEDGFIKLIADRRGVLIGATIVASRAGEMSGEMSLAIAQRLRRRRCRHRRARVSDLHDRSPADGSQTATARWTSSAAGRFIGRLLGFAGRR